MLYGGPVGTTDLDSASQDFGLYGVPAKLLINVFSGSCTYQTREPGQIDAPSD
jgi:hypothetical protein